ncbi:hypothetical protein [Streptomyces telluris]|uniref:Uncharacterized protein n=1 Tax=Streptomyces telluris TaxID=2720021 RepID=A0A9X2RS44_9ACTN|nr:hypothetical protein [Streptomyces telluris]MCQ8774196.1 hypothetical protein [Streptomyces telluris]NJP82084.1 hypothetical protein [Streptomyces telluris]
MKWSLVRWDEGAIELAWVVVEEGNSYRLRKLTKDGDDNAIIYVDQALMNILKWQKERQDPEKVSARRLASQQDHERPQRQGEPGRGLEERPASQPRLHNGALRQAPPGRRQGAGRPQRQPDRAGSRSSLIQDSRPVVSWLVTLLVA